KPPQVPDSCTASSFCSLLSFIGQLAGVICPHRWIFLDFPDWSCQRIGTVEETPAAPLAKRDSGRVSVRDATKKRVVPKKSWAEERLALAHLRFLSPTGFSGTCAGLRK